MLYQQPQGAPAQIDWSNPITKGLAIAIDGNTPAVNLATVQPVVSTGSVTKLNGDRGIGLTYPSSAGTGIKVNATTVLRGSLGNGSGTTILILANPKSSSTRVMPFSIGGPSPETYIAFNANASLGGSPGTFACCLWNYSGAAGLANAVDGKTHMFGVILPEGASSYTPELYLDGAGPFPEVSTTFFPPSNAWDTVAGYQGGGFSATDYSQFLTLAFNRVLSPAEMKSIAANPWQVFIDAEEEDEHLLYVQSGGGTDTPVNPAVGTLTLTGYAPTIARTANQSIAPTTGALAVSGYAPTVTRTANQALTAGAGTLALTGYAPSVAQSSGTAVALGAGSLALIGYAPTITQPKAVAPGAGSLSITGYAPSVTQGITTNIVPSVGSLALSGYAPTIAQSANQSASPGAGTLAITGYAPSLTQTANQSVLPAVGGLTISGYAPTVVQVSASPSLNPAAGLITITGYAPEVAQSGMAAAPEYSIAPKRRYIVRKDGKLLVFTDPELAKAVLHEDDESEPTKQQPAKRQKKAAPKVVPVATPPEEVVDLAEVKALADRHQADEEYKRLMAQQQYEKILDLLHRLEDEEEDEWLLMAAA